MERNFKLVVEQSRHGRRQLSVDNEFHGTLTTAWSA